MNYQKENYFRLGLISVFDNGRGFELPEVLDDFAGPGKLGLIGMRE